MLTTGLLSGTDMEEQIRRERESVRRGVKRYRDEVNETIRKGRGSEIKPADRLIAHWFTPLRDALAADRSRCLRGDRDYGWNIFGPVLAASDPDVLAVVAIREALSQLLKFPDGIPRTKFAYTLGRAALAEIAYEDLRHKNREAFDKLNRKYKRLHPQIVNQWANKNLSDPPWNSKVCAGFGVWLQWRLCEHSFVNVTDQDGKRSQRLAFHVRKERDPRRMKWQMYVEADEEVYAAIGRGIDGRGVLRPIKTLMVVPPMPWGKVEDGEKDREKSSGQRGGGYITIRVPYMTKPTRTQKDAMASADLTEEHACINAIQGQPLWINTFIRDVQRQLFEEGGGVVGVASKHDRPMPAELVPPYTDDEIRARKGERVATYRQNISLGAEREMFHEQLRQADEVAGRTCWAPVRNDFRGRFYPDPGHMSYHGPDATRALICFPPERPPCGSMDDEAIKWLAVHAANCFGQDKLSVVDRVAWSMDHLKAMQACADDPLQNRWWMEAGEPFRFLAATRAFFDPDAAASAVVAMDATCSGMQHYAAIMRDEQTAALVNMLPSDERMPRSDFYGTIAGATAPEAHASGDDALQIVFDGLKAGMFKWRDLVKQPVMTKVYGVTAIGAREQQEDVLLDRLYGGRRTATWEQKRAAYRASIVLSQMTMRAMGGACPRVDAAMAYIQRGAHHIAKAGFEVAWTAPTGLPVVQPYHKLVQIDTIVGVLRIATGDGPLDTKRHRSSSAPNFIHSIDMAHAKRTGRAVISGGGAFFAVHDEFNTRPWHRPTVARLAREQFIKLHEVNRLEMLREEWMLRFGVNLPEIPEGGGLDITGILENPNFFN